MINKRFLWLIIVAALVLCGGTLFAAEEKAAAAGPEKVMIYSGENLKVQLEGRIRFNLIQNEYNVYQESLGLWVNNQKWGTTAFFTVPSAVAGVNLYTKSFWLPYQKALRRGSLVTDVRETGLALNVQGPKILGAESFAAIKVDFFGGYGVQYTISTTTVPATGGNSVRNPVLRLRNAFAGLEWKGEVVSAKFTFGQFNSLIIPMLAYPVSLNYVPFYYKGVLFNYDQGISVGIKIGSDKANLMIDVSLVRAMAGNDGADLIYTGVNGSGIAAIDERGTGEASMRPAWNGRVAFNLKPHQLFGLTLAATGSYFTQHTRIAYNNLRFIYGIDITNGIFVNAADVASKSVGAQAKLQIAFIVIQGAGWMGEAMQNYYAMFGTGVRESTTGLKNLPDKGRGGYAQIYIALQKIGIPIMPYVGMGQEIKNNRSRIPNSQPASLTEAGTHAPTTSTYVVTTTGRIGVSTILWNSEVHGGLRIFLGQNMNLGFEMGQIVTKFKGVPGTSTSMVYRTAAEFVF